MGVFFAILSIGLSNFLLTNLSYYVVFRFAA